MTCVHILDGIPAGTDGRLIRILDETRRRVRVEVRHHGQRMKVELHARQVSAAVQTIE